MLDHRSIDYDLNYVDGTPIIGSHPIHTHIHMATGKQQSFFFHIFLNVFYRDVQVFFLRVGGGRLCCSTLVVSCIEIGTVKKRHGVYLIFKFPKTLDVTTLNICSR